MTCPDEECHKGKERLEQCVEGIKMNYLSKGTAKWFVGMLLVVLLAFVGAQAKTQVDVNKVKTKTEVTISQFQAIKEQLDKQPTKGDIYRIIKQILRENGK